MISASAQAPSVASLIEIRPAGARVVGPGADLMSDAVAERLRRIPHVTKVEKYLFIGMRDRSDPKELFVIAGYTPGARPRVNCHNVEEARVVQGRFLRPEDAGKLIAVGGIRFAAAYKGGLRVGQTVPLLPSPAERRGLPAAVKGARVQVVGLFAFAHAFTLGERQLFLPLDTAQRLFGLRGKISKLFVEVDSAAVREDVAEAIRAVLGESFDVLLPKAGGMR